MTNIGKLLSSLRDLSVLVVAIACLGLGIGVASTAKAADAKAPPLSLAFQRLVKEKRALEERIAHKQGQAVPSQVSEFFAAAGRGDWAATSNLFFSLKADSLASPFLGAVSETFGVCEKMATMSPEFLQIISDGILKSISSGSIYFGGNDTGRYGPILQSTSHNEGRPFFTLSQNALADRAYRGYVRDMYGEKIRIPTDDEAALSLAQYTEDAGRRLRHDQESPGEPKQIKPGEDVRWADGKVQMEGHICLMELNARLAKMIFDKNPAREFYYVESFPLDWLYPHLTPHQFVFKVQRQPVAELSQAVVREDREFWTRHADKWLGPWLKMSTSVSDVTNFVVRTYLEKSPAPFHADPHFVQDTEARRFLSHIRGSVGGLYAWRAGIAKSQEERQRMLAEAEFAYCQAFAFSPENPVAVLRYVNQLAAADLSADAVRVAAAAQRMDPKNTIFESLLADLRSR